MSNGSIDYKLGELSSDVKDIKGHIGRLEVKVDRINAWRWKIIGISTGISATAAVVFSRL